MALTQETVLVPNFVDLSTIPNFVPLPTTPDSPPDSLRELLLSLLNKEVRIFTEFDTALRGTLIAVELDYVVLRQSDGAEVLISTSHIEAVGGI